MIEFFTSIRTKCAWDGVPSVVHVMTWPISTIMSVCLTTHPKSLPAPGMLTGHGGGLAAACQGVERQAAEGPFRRAGCRLVHHLNWQGTYNNIQ